MISLPENLRSFLLLFTIILLPVTLLIIMFFIPNNGDKDVSNILKNFDLFDVSNGFIPTTFKAAFNTNQLSKETNKISADGTSVSPLIPTSVEVIGPASMIGLVQYVVNVSQSSTLELFVATLAIDGHKNGNFWAKSCSCTSGQDQGLPWWKIHFRRQFIVHKIIIYNRIDCCDERLEGGKVLIYDKKDEKLCANIIGIQAIYDLLCRIPLIGDMLKIIGPNPFLTICELEVFGYEAN